MLSLTLSHGWRPLLQILWMHGRTFEPHQYSTWGNDPLCFFSLIENPLTHLVRAPHHLVLVLAPWYTLFWRHRPDGSNLQNLTIFFNIMVHQRKNISPLPPSAWMTRLWRGTNGRIGMLRFSLGRVCYRPSKYVLVLPHTRTHAM